VDAEIKANFTVATWAIKPKQKSLILEGKKQDDRWLYFFSSVPN
jgi:hypothetical protein